MGGVGGRVVGGGVVALKVVAGSVEATGVVGGAVVISSASKSEETSRVGSV